MDKTYGEEIMNQESSIYPIVFMIIICVFFVGILATAFRFSEAKIEQNEIQAYRIQLVSLFEDDISEHEDSGFSELINKDNIDDTYSKYFRELKLSDRRAYEVVINDVLQGYCFDIAGNGLWGSMRALIATSPDLNMIKGISIYSQMETPGLGARIEEETFRQQFEGKNLFLNGAIVEYSLIPEDQMPSLDTEIKQITGATITSRSVLNMISSEMSQIKSSWEVNR